MEGSNNAVLGSFTPVGAYTIEDKKALAEAITKACVDFAEIPAFFVNVRFQETPENTMFWAGSRGLTSFES